jgi:hypothetical protein
VTVPEGEDEEFDVSHIFVVCVKSLPRRRGKYLLFMTHFRDDDIPPDWHRLCCEIPMAGMIMDTSVRCIPGESWPYYLANSGCIAGASYSSNTGVYIRDISPMGTDFSARYLVTAYGSGHGGAGSIPGDGISVYPFHRLNEVHRTTALQNFLETPQWHKFAKIQAYIDFMHAYPTRIPESQ